ncbi:hypothetical protein ACDH50_20250, partial [Xanthomonas fragariae]|uniref:hypothetical protein n=1 Tax=Xanthomonas fragariae TaxID=48664 RepID=UPI00353056CD
MPIPSTGRASLAVSAVVLLAALGPDICYISSIPTTCQMKQSANGGWKIRIGEVVFQKRQSHT